MLAAQGDAELQQAEICGRYRGDMGEIWGDIEGDAELQQAEMMLGLTLTLTLTLTTTLTLTLTLTRPR